MFNVLLDNSFPNNYKGHELNTDFRVGIKLTLLQEDEEFDDYIKLLKSFEILYKYKIPEWNTAIDGLIWFLSCGKSEIYFDDNVKEDDIVDKCLDFNIDHMDIWGAFWSKGVDLTKVNMHWFKFMSALSNVGDCPLTQKIAYRSTDLSKLKGDTRKYYADLKEKYKVRKIMTKDEYNEIMSIKEESYGSHWAYLMRMQRGR